MNEKITITRTSSSNKDFQLLVSHLDHELWNELQEDQAQYDQYNKVPDLPTVVLLYVNEEPAACGCYKIYDRHTVEIKRMFVEKQYRKRGLSRIILKELERWAVESEFQYSLLETSIHFAAARTLYTSAGYIIIPNYDQYAGLPESICMKKTLLQPSPFVTLKNEIEYFDFEEDFVEEGIRCIPMIVRFKLDKAGIKLKLCEWAKFSHDEKCQLALQACSTTGEIFIYRETVKTNVQNHTGKAPTLIPVDPLPAWEDISTAPDELTNKLAAFGIIIHAGQWSSLTELQRFALVKLCRSGHENRNLPIALKEFGLMK